MNSSRKHQQFDAAGMCLCGCGLTRLEDTMRRYRLTAFINNHVPDDGTKVDTTGNDGDMISLDNQPYENNR
jgi:hypothetical protein